MSVTFTSQSSDMEGYTMDLVDSEAWSQNKRSSGHWRRPAAVCMGLLALALLIAILSFVARGPGVNNSQSTTQVPTSQNKCENLTRHWMQLQTSYSSLSENTIQLQHDYHSLEKEKEALTAERDATRVDRDSLRAEMDLLKPERDALASERDSLLDEMSSLKADRDNLTLDQEFLRLERDALKPERDSLRQERDQLRGEKDAIVAERDGLRAEQEVLKPERDALKNQLDSLQVDQAQLRVQNDRLKESNSNLTVRMEALQKKYHTLLDSTKLTVNASENVCPISWIKFQNKCYYISKKSETKGWIFAKRDCERRRGHLVIINSKEENDFVSRFYDQTWIGLSDTEEEGKWKWVNGVDFAGEGFWMQGEPNGASSKEDCAEVTQERGEWNDVACSKMLSYVCEM
ncbi:low affinity immunoglobulin epsilon Fc receptor-like [Synchiropus splendidus]|uniref:low affinity immunoglobulin epsilon Fc receptor-like n=1 Tax=Synchiropus splendidus TaxID=270530 RepID=UPI00237D448D|nr:low affinity immunoglobulin epsilon Fc receptor-like [Synchiropus splendidus]